MNIKSNKSRKAPSIVHVLYNTFMKYCLNATINTEENDMSATFNKNELDPVNVTKRYYTLRTTCNDLKPTIEGGGNIM